MSPCSTPATMSKYSVSPSGDRTFTLVFLVSSNCSYLRNSLSYNFSFSLHTVKFKIQTFQYNISTVLVYTQLNVKTVLFRTIQFSVSAASQ